VNAYVVADATGGLFVRLEGPYEYVRWSLGTQATPMTLAKAHQYASIVGGVVRAVSQLMPAGGVRTWEGPATERSVVASVPVNEWGVPL
jgi:hypothetical protein